MRFEMHPNPSNSGKNSSYSNHMDSIDSASATPDAPSHAGNTEHRGEVLLCKATVLTDQELEPLSGWLSTQLEQLEDKMESFVTPNSLRRSLARTR